LRKNIDFIQLYFPIEEVFDVRYRGRIDTAATTEDELIFAAAHLPACRPGLLSRLEILERTEQKAL
jgi:hypothetical protein